MSIPISDPDAEVTFDAWQELCEKSDRDSGDPDMCLITEEELRELMSLSYKGGLHQAAILQTIAMNHTEAMLNEASEVEADTHEAALERRWEDRREAF